MGNSLAKVKSLRLSVTAFLLLWLAEMGFADGGVRAVGGGISRRPKWVPNEIIVKFKRGVSNGRIKQVNQRHTTSVLHSSQFARFKKIEVAKGKTAREMVGLYNGEPDVEYAELNYYAYAFFVPNDTYYNYQWHFNDANAGINIESVWDITTGDPNIIVAVLDTGVAYEDFKGFQQAPDLANTRFVPGYDFINSDEHPNDDDGHGTHVTGTLAQSTDNALGTAGIAFDCNIMPVKVLSRRGVGTYTDIADGIYFAANNGADIINMSLGGVSDSTTLRNAVAYAYNQGVTIICAAGNEYLEGNAPAYPAAYDEYCIAVGATRFDRTRAYYSNTGSYLDVVAPGGDLYVDQNGDGYDDGILQQTFGYNPKDWGYFFYQGTSMAAPHVSGIAALLISTGVTGPDAIREALETTARDLGSAGWDEEYGWGLVDAYAALNYYHILADFNYDGVVDFEDLGTLSDNWLDYDPFVDIAPGGGDGIINFLDYAEWAAAYGG
jgi:serine protease